MWRGDEGSALMLMPAAVLVVIVLAAIAVDAAVQFLGERELAAATAAAANDAAVAALDPRAFYACEGLVVDARQAQNLARESFANRSSDAVTVTSMDVDVVAAAAGPAVRVAATGTVPLIFSPAVPSGRSAATVDAVSVARPRTAGAEAASAC